MSHEFSYWEKIRGCCKDEAAFMHLRQILGDSSGCSDSSSLDLQAIFQAFPDLQFRLDANARVLSYHAGSAANLYVPPEEFLGKSVLDFLPLSVGSRIVSAVNQVLETKSLASIEYALPGADGEMIFEARLLPLLESQVIAIVRDITEQRRAESAIRKLEEKFSRTFRSSLAAVNISTFAEGRFIEINDTFVEITGYSRAEVVGRKASELCIWANPEDGLQIRELLRSQGTVRNKEYEFRKKSGEIIIGLVSAEIMEFDGELCILAITNDITESKRTEAKLQAATERDRLLGEIALRIRRSLNLDQILQTTVAEVRQLLRVDRVFIGCADGFSCGRIAAESVDPRWEQILCVPDQKALKELRAEFECSRALVIDNTSQSELSPIKRQLMEQYHVKASLSVPIWLGDCLLGALVVHQCETPRHWEQFEIDLLEKLATQVAIAMQQAQLYRQVQTLNANLEQQVQERTLELQKKLQEVEELGKLKDFFIHAISHDLRTPIMGMLMTLKNFLSKGCRGEGAESRELENHAHTVDIPKSVLERIVQNSDRQLEMLNILLDSQALEKGDDILKLKCFRLNTLTDTVAQAMFPFLSKKQANLIDLVPVDLPPVVLDAVQMRRVFENLIANSLNRNPPGLNITIDAKVVGADIKNDVKNRLNAGTDEIYCTIHDNGNNIENCECLFERYSKGDHAKYSTGISLGLYFCRQVVLAHGGQIGVSSEPGQGSLFWMRLPLRRESSCQESSN